MKEAHFSHLHPGSCSFGLNPHLMTVDEDRNRQSVCLFSVDDGGRSISGVNSGAMLLFKFVRNRLPQVLSGRGTLSLSQTAPLQTVARVSSVSSVHRKIGYFLPQVL